VRIKEKNKKGGVGRCGGGGPKRRVRWGGGGGARARGSMRSGLRGSSPSARPRRGARARRGRVPSGRARGAASRARGRPADGAFTGVARRLQVGDALRLGELRGGALHYDPGWRERPLWLLAAGTGLAPLWGVLREALRQRHQGPIRLMHQARDASGHYLAAS